jgi:hypothetical protein
MRQARWGGGFELQALRRSAATVKSIFILALIYQWKIIRIILDGVDLHLL